VKVNEEEVSVEDGSLEFSATEAGVYRFVLSEAKYLEEEHTVYAVSA
jgi:hypothetical protein